MDVRVDLALSALAAGPGQCFIGYEKSDVLWQGRKIAGAAQRRTRNGLLIQGSVQPPPVKIAREQWEREMIRAESAEGSRTWKEMEVCEVLQKRANELVRQKFGQESYNRKR